VVVVVVLPLLSMMPRTSAATPSSILYKRKLGFIDEPVA
jgi:hypothetical protein